MKICRKCKIEQPLENYTRCNRSKDGRLPRCKKCILAYFNANKEKFLKCNREIYKNKKISLEYKQKRQEESKKYRQKYKIKLKDYYKKYKESNRLRSKKYFEQNKDTIKLKISAYKKANRAKFNFINSRRRAAQLQATPKWLSEFDLSYIKSIYIQAKQLEKLDGIKRHVDHIIPLKGKTVTGLHVPWNLQILTAEENVKKNNKVIYE
jgi:hypothetical protein